MPAAGILLHGFGQRYDLPASLALYLFAAGGVVVLGTEQVIAQPLQRGPVGGRERLAILQPGQRRQRR